MTTVTVEVPNELAELVAQVGGHYLIGRSIV